MLKSHPDVHMVWYGNAISRTRYSNNLYYKGLCGEATHYAVYMCEHSQVISNIVSLYWIEYCVVTEKSLWSSCNPRTLEAEAAELWDTAQPGQRSEFKATLGCIAKLSQKCFEATWKETSDVWCSLRCIYYLTAVSIRAQRNSGT